MVGLSVEVLRLFFTKKGGEAAASLLQAVADLLPCLPKLDKVASETWTKWNMAQ